ncbi:hypothetical protein Tco_0487117 [Tanacetum coccineum]
MRADHGLYEVKSGSTKLVMNSNSYLRDILGDILGKDITYEKIHVNDDAKGDLEAIRTRFQQLLSQLEAHGAENVTAKGTYDGKKKRDSLYQHQEAGKQEKNQMGLLTMDDGIVNWGEHTEAEESNHALNGYQTQH